MTYHIGQVRTHELVTVVVPVWTWRSKATKSGATSYRLYMYDKSMVVNKVELTE
jgi:hypothetical protein